MEHGECHVHVLQYITSLFSPILFLLFIIYSYIHLCFSNILVLLFFFFQSKNIFINKNKLFEWIQTLSQPRFLSQCSLMLQHLIRTSPIGTRGVSRTCQAVHNISLFTHSLFVVYFLCLYPSLFFSNVFILFFFLFLFQLKQSSSTTMNCFNGYQLFPNLVHCHSVQISYSI